tara:strand:- start:425 stop:994 length:570 start_codon:yes stop_codon:yes gene_type:complete
MKNNSLRITSGHLRSRKIDYLSNEDLRPTKSYIREVIFNVCKLDNDFNTLDLFSGSGILTFESISRGAKVCHLVESNKKICEKYLSECKKLNIENSILFNCDVFKFLQSEQIQDYQLIFIDPPYKDSCLHNVIDMLFQRNFLQNNKYIYFEQDRKSKDKSTCEYLKLKYDIIKDLSIGDVSYTIAKKRN